MHERYVEAVDHKDAATKARDNYDRMAEVYTDFVATALDEPTLARVGLEHFAHLVQKGSAGRVADVGCGPGYITAYLHDLGLDIFGLDISPAMIDIARASYPGLSFDTGELMALPIETDTLGGVVSRHSLIHTPPDLVTDALDEFARVLTPGGLLCVSFFGAEQPDRHGKAFDHTVSTAYRFDVDRFAGQLAVAGLDEEVRMIRQPGEGERQLPDVLLFARRRHG